MMMQYNNNIYNLIYYTHVRCTAYSVQIWSLPSTDTNSGHIPLVFHCSQQMVDRRLPLLE